MRLASNTDAAPSAASCRKARRQRPADATGRRASPCRLGATPRRRGARLRGGTARARAVAQPLTCRVRRGGARSRPRGQCALLRPAAGRAPAARRRASRSRPRRSKRAGACASRRRSGRPRPEGGLHQAGLGLGRIDEPRSFGAGRPRSRRRRGAPRRRRRCSTRPICAPRSRAGDGDVARRRVPRRGRLVRATGAGPEPPRVRPEDNDAKGALRRGGTPSPRSRSRPRRDAAARPTDARGHPAVAVHYKARAPAGRRRAERRQSRPRSRCGRRASGAADGHLGPPPPSGLAGASPLGRARLSGAVGRRPPSARRRPRAGRRRRRFSPTSRRTGSAAAAAVLVHRAAPAARAAAASAARQPARRLRLAVDLHDHVPDFHAGHRERWWRPLPNPTASCPSGRGQSGGDGVVEEDVRLRRAGHNRGRRRGAWLLASWIMSRFGLLLRVVWAAAALVFPGLVGGALLIHRLPLRAWRLLAYC